MKNATKVLWIALTAALPAVPASSQSTPQPLPPAVVSKPAEQPKYFRLDFIVKELENGKVMNVRAYSTSSDNARGFASIRAGDKIPVASEKGPTYVDVGVNIDCRELKLIDNQLSVQISADISNPSSDSPNSSLVIRQYRWTGVAFVPLRKPVTVFSSEGVSNKRQMQLELTATPIP